MEHKTILTIIGILIPFVGTTLGAGVVFFFKNNVSIRMQKVFNGFAAGVMFAASIWSLIIPAIDMETSQGKIGWIPASIGIIVGVLILLLTDTLAEKSMDKNHVFTQNKKNKMLNFAITLHNIPERNGSTELFSLLVFLGNYGMQMMSAFALSLGIAIQNFPEGMAISLPYKSAGASRKKAFWTGTLSGVVEPIAAVITILISSIINKILPYLLAFAARSNVVCDYLRVNPRFTRRRTF